MSRRVHRAVRRQFAILGVLAEEHALFADAIARKLHRASGTLYGDLGALEREGRIVRLHTTSDGNSDPARTAYRLPNADERRRRTDGTGSRSSWRGD